MAARICRFFIVKQLSAVRLFFGAAFISSEFTDIYFEVK